jgi:predicted nucleic-acid-binding protein
VSIVTTAETAWVLERIYGLTAGELAAAIEWMLQVNVLVVENEQKVFTAMTAVKEGRGSFADALIGALGAKMGCSHTVTFDQKALRLPDFQLL